MKKKRTKAAKEKQLIKPRKDDKRQIKKKKKCQKE